MISAAIWARIVALPAADRSVAASERRNRHERDKALSVYVHGTPSRAQRSGGDWRLHGSPINYCSSYEEARLKFCAEQIRAETRKGREAWCMFDNTLSAFATVNALALMERL